MKAAALAIFDGPGEARAAARLVDWAATTVGSPQTWPVSLRTTLGILLGSRHPMFLWWGPELIQFYNDAYLPSFGRGKHPAAMGQRGADCWQEIWPIIFPQIDDVMARGQASWNQDQLVPIYRNDQLEEVYWTYGYSPVHTETGAVGGVLVVCTETTAGVLAMRRLDFVRRLAIALNVAQQPVDVARITAEALGQAALDIPYAVVSAEGMPPFRVGLAAAAIPTLGPAESTGNFARHQLVDELICAPWPERVTHAVRHSLEGIPGGMLTLGLSPRLPFDTAYRHFLQQIAEQVASAQARVAVALERRRLLLQAPVATAVVMGPEHVFELANPRFVEMVSRDVLGKTTTEAFPELGDTGIPGILAQVYREGQPFATQEMRVPLQQPEGGLKDRYFNFNVEPIRDVHGVVYGMMVVAVDITSQVQARSALEQTNRERSQLLEAARVASRAKDEFLAMLGHELRNPLAPILTAVELMKSKNGERVEHERQIIERQAKHLVHLVDDLLDVSRVAAGKIELKKRQVALAEVVAAAIETASPLLETRHHELSVEVPASGLSLNADPMRLAQVIANLLTNAARYTDAGGKISIHGSRVGDAAVLRVTDTGCGLDAAQIPHLFERFFQIPRSGHRAQGGLGLGLALVKGLVELHGGSVRAESPGLGLGSSFELRLPLGRSDVASQARPNELPSSPRVVVAERVLLIDDNSDITELFGTLLQLAGYDVEAAHDGPSALRLAATYKPTVAVLDLGLPVMDGYEIAAQLRQQLGAAAPRLIAMSGYGQREDIERTRQAGFEKHLVKPVDANSLLRAIAGR